GRVLVLGGAVAALASKMLFHRSADHSIFRRFGSQGRLVQITVCLTRDIERPLDEYLLRSLRPRSSQIAASWHVFPFLVIEATAIDGLLLESSCPHLMAAD